MDKNIELQIVDISNSQAQVGAYALVLGEIKGSRQMPIIIGPAEAQVATMYLKGLKAPRPLTHDLFYNCLNALTIQILKVVIYKVKDGIFYSYVYLKKEEEVLHIDSRTSDAVVLAICSGCPIYIYESILENECIYPEGDNDAEQKMTIDERDGNGINSLNDEKLAELEDALERAIKEEDYEYAILLRDELNRTK